jgi:hypothetical protein
MVDEMTYSLLSLLNIFLNHRLYVYFPFSIPILDPTMLCVSTYVCLREKRQPSHILLAF